MNVTKGTGKSKKICCWLLTGILWIGQSGLVAYAEEITAGDGNAEAPVTETLADNGIQTAAYLDLPPLKGNTEFDAEGFHWQVIETGTDSSNELLRCMGAASGTQVSGKLVIPDRVVYANYEYKVFHIAPGAFANCTELTELEILEGVPNHRSDINTMSIGSQSGSDPGAFAGCTNLKKVTLPNTVTAIYSSTFRGCTALESVTFAEPAGYGHGGINSIGGWSFAGCSALRDVSFENVSGGTYITRSIANYAFLGCTSLEHIELPDSINYVGDEAFRDCTSLKKIKLPEKTAGLRTRVFKDCSSLTEVEMSDQTAITGSNVFDGCSVLQTLKIDTTAPSAGNSWTTVNVDGAASMGALPTERKVVFLNSGGTAYLTGSLLADAQAAYRAVNDGTAGDDYWYGWEISKIEMYPIEITVRKDGAVWADSGKSYRLSANGTDFIPYIPGNTDVLGGTYRIYEVVGSGSGLMDTKTDVTVDEDHASGEAEINYYTVTFYHDFEGKAPYGEGTAQKPQIVLGGSGASQPADPAAAEGYRFGGWMEEITGSRELVRFDFAHTMIAKTTDLYAYWEPVYYQLKVSAGAGGRVTPGNNINVKYGEDQTIIITPEQGYRIKEILIDGVPVADKDFTDKESYTYVFSDVKEEHRIEAVFEEDSAAVDPEKPDRPEPSEKPDQPEKPDRPGTTDTPDKPGNPGNSENQGISPKPGLPGTSDTPANNAPGTSSVAVPPAAGGGNVGNSSTSGQNRQTKTGDGAPIEMYATLAMIAGLTDVMLFFAANKKGMTEKRKKELVSVLVSWAKRGGRLRRYAALAVICGVLLYYHSFGKHISGNSEQAESAGVSPVRIF